MKKSDAETLFEVVKPHLETLSLGEVYRLTKHLRNDSLGEFKHFVNKSKNKNIKVIYDTNKCVFNSLMRKG